ncbi:MAG: polyphenol oxidase family protein [Actinomycetia bacterium]|nr:polyphenol oxidase family protein [Actinomycetes bacterium]
MPTSAGVVNIVFTDRSDGDLRPLPAAVGDGHVDRDHPHLTEVAGRRQAITPEPWTWLRQIHGGRTVFVSHPGELAGVAADAAVTVTPGCPLSVTTADCAPVVLIAEGGVAVIHAGWRGLVADIVATSASQLRAVAGAPVAAILGPCINAAAYEFGAEALALAVAGLGPTVEARTGWGTPALDVPAAVAVACERAGWPPPTDPAPCTSDQRWYSHRTRADESRQAAVAWLG